VQRAEHPDHGVLRQLERIVEISGQMECEQVRGALTGSGELLLSLAVTTLSRTNHPRFDEAADVRQGVSRTGSGHGNAHFNYYASDST
jgi:hypothetical protein